MGQVVLFALAVAGAYVVGSLLGREARRHDLDAIDRWRAGELPSAKLFEALGTKTYCDTFCVGGHRVITGPHA